MRRAPGHSVLAGLLAGLAAALATGILGCAGGTAPPAGPAVTAGPGTRGGSWLVGSAGHLLSVVNADLGRLSAAERASKPGLARIAGMRLSADAQAALLAPPPPVAARVYRSALTELERAGRCAAGGNLRAAAASLRAGEAGITKATATFDSLAAPRSAGATVTGPARQ